MAAPFQFHFIRTGIKNYIEIANLAPMFSPYLDPVFRQSVFEVIRRQFEMVSEDRHVDYTLEIHIGDADPKNDGVSLEGSVQGVNVSYTRFSIPKYLEQLKLSPEDRLKYASDEYSPQARNQHWIFLLKALGLYLPQYTDADHPKFLNGWPGEVNSFIQAVQKEIPDIHHRIYNYIERRSSNRIFLPIIDLQRLLGEPSLKLEYATRRMITAYIAERHAAASYEVTAVGELSADKQDRNNLHRYLDAVMPSYPILIKLDQWHQSLLDNNDPHAPFKILTGVDLSTKSMNEFFVAEVVPLTHELVKQKPYQDITDEFFPVPKESGTKK